MAFWAGGSRPLEESALSLSFSCSLYFSVSVAEMREFSFVFSVKLFPDSIIKYLVPNTLPGWITSMALQVLNNLFRD